MSSNNEDHDGNKLFLKRRETTPLEGFLRTLDHSTLSYEAMQTHAWAGGVSGIVAETMMHPFDTISTRLKIQGAATVTKTKYHGLVDTTMMMIREEGFFSLFRGVSATIYCAIPSSAIYFGAYEWIKHAGVNLSKLNLDTHSVFHEDAVHLLAGMGAELASSCIVVPFEVVKTRMQIGTGHTYSGAMSGMWRIIREEGIGGLYSGYRACILLDCTHSGLQFLIYERLKRIFKEDAASENYSLTESLLADAVEETAQDIAIGAAAGGVAAFISNPLDVVTARLMAQSSMDATRQKYTGIFNCLGSIMAREGIKGLWMGAAARVLSIAPLSALTFAVYEKMKWFLSE